MRLKLNTWLPIGPLLIPISVPLGSALRRRGTSPEAVIPSPPCACIRRACIFYSCAWPRQWQLLSSRADRLCVLPSHSNSFITPFRSLTIASCRCFPGCLSESAVCPTQSAPIPFFAPGKISTLVFGLSRCLPPPAVPQVANSTIPPRLHKQA